MKTVPVELRPSITSDAAALADLHADAWRYAYQGIIPATTLASMIANRDKKWWEKAQLVAGPALVLQFGSLIAGYATFGPYRHSAALRNGEIYELYLRPEAYGAGFGRRLFDAARLELRQKGCTGVTVWCLRDNELGVQFYEALGGKQIRQGTQQIGGARLRIVAYHWE